MPKSNLIHDVEVIAEKISRKNIRESRAIVQLGTWINALKEENRALKKRVDELEIRVKKLNDYGATPLTKSEVETAPEKIQNRITPTQMKKFRLSRNLSQRAMAGLLNVAIPKYARWESGKSVVVQAVEQKFFEIQKWKASELRSRLQGLGIFQTDGKRTKIKPIQGPKSIPENTVKEPEQKKPALKEVARRPIAPTLISHVQIKELRTALGFSQGQLGAIVNVNRKTLANWEYGSCRPPVDCAKKLLEMYNEHFPQSQTATTSAPTLRKRKYYESSAFPRKQIQTSRKARGFTCAQAAERIGVPLTTYKNWEAGNSRPSEEMVEKLISLLGNPPQTAIRQPESQKKTRQQWKNFNPEKRESALYIRKLRETLGLSNAQMGRLFGVSEGCYQNWESLSRGVPVSYLQKAKELIALDEAGRSKKLREVGITVPAGRKYPPQKGASEK